MQEAHNFVLLKIYILGDFRYSDHAGKQIFNKSYYQLINMNISNI